MFALLERYTPGPYHGRITLFVPRLSHQRLANFRKTWRDLARGGLEVCVAPGDHENFIRAPLVEVLAAKVRDRIHATTDPTPAQAAQAPEKSSPASAPKNGFELN
jgi:hypothetical protein